VTNVVTAALQNDVGDGDGGGKADKAGGDSGGDADDGTAERSAAATMGTIGTFGPMTTRIGSNSSSEEGSSFARSTN
jgi:hypothetical protein